MGLILKEIQSIATFLKHDSLQIPTFQRPYKWGVHNVVQLIEDIKRFQEKDDYRIGSIVIYEDDESIDEGETKKDWNIVDGQQRTITFMLIIKALLQIPDGRLLSDILHQLRGIEAADFNPVFSSSISQGNIKRNYLEIARRSDSFDDRFVQFFLNQCKVNVFVIDDISEAFQFFDSQNARGKDLEPHDLLKAFHLRELDEVSKSELLSPEEKGKLVDTWEAMNTEALANLFANFLYRVRGWSRGDSSRYFGKKDTPLFKGITLNKIGNYPYTEVYKLLDVHLRSQNTQRDKVDFPFQLDQTIINGKYFFEMITYYKNVYDELNNSKSTFTEDAQKIMTTINEYSGKNRTGDKYVRMLFNCALIYYVDKFGKNNISEAIKKIFVWAYSIRLRRQSLQLASVDNYVIHEYNIFKKIKSAFHHHEILSLELPLIDPSKEFKSDKTADIRAIFIEMKYYTSHE